MKPIALILLLVCFHTLITTTRQPQEERVEMEKATRDRVPWPAPLLNTALAQRPHLLLLLLLLALPLLILILLLLSFSLQQVWLAPFPLTSCEQRAASAFPVRNFHSAAV